MELSEKIFDLMVVIENMPVRIVEREISTSGSRRKDLDDVQSDTPSDWFFDITHFEVGLLLFKEIS